MAGRDDERVGEIVAGLAAEHVAIHELPGVAWGVVRGGELIAAHDEASVYRIASMTKSFTCAAVLALRDDGVFGLDDPIATHAPELVHIVGPTRDSPPITIRHLMTMGAGFATDDAWADRHLDVGDDELDRWLAGGVTFAAPPDTKWEYSNLGFGFLGRVVLRATSRRVQDHVTEQLLRSLGMRRTTWTAPDDAQPGHRSRRGDGDEPLLGDGSIAPMGGIFTTVADLARWVSFMLDAWPPRDEPDDAPLARASRREMQQVQRAFPPRVVTARDGRTRTIAGGYGYGLNVTHHDRFGWVVSHSGGLPGFGSNMRWVPSAGIGIVALSNRTYAPMAEFTAAALDALVAGGEAEPAPIVPNDNLRRAATQLVELHDRWDGATATRLFADNVALDDSYERRALAVEAFAAHRPWRLARIEALSATEGTAIAHGDGAELHVEFQLHPLAPPKVQWYESKLHS